MSPHYRSVTKSGLVVNYDSTERHDFSKIFSICYRCDFCGSYNFEIQRENCNIKVNNCHAPMHFEIFSNELNN